MKLTVLGGGGVRSAFLAKSLAYNAHRIGLTEVVFLDNSADNLAIFGEIARYVFTTIRPDIHFTTTTDPVAALQNANYIITTLRVGGDESRIRDERIAPVSYTHLDVYKRQEPNINLKRPVHRRVPRYRVVDLFRRWVRGCAQGRGSQLRTMGNQHHLGSGRRHGDLPDRRGLRCAP